VRIDAQAAAIPAEAKYQGRRLLVCSLVAEDGGINQDFNFSFAATNTAPYGAFINSVVGYERNKAHSPSVLITERVQSKAPA
jgi:hypothetical protein